MRTGIMLPNGIPERPCRAIADYAVTAERRGFDSLGVIDRVAYDCVDPFVALATAAAVTENVELVTDLVVGPLRSTALLASQAAAVDLVSGGRMTLGVGVGVREDDFTVTGTDFHDRGLRFDRQLTDLGRIWSGDATVGASPTRTGGPRLLIGGRADLAAPRAARHGAGWTMAIGGPEQLADGVAQVHEQWAEVGRTDRRYVMAMLYTAVGPDADDLAAGAIGSYYAWLGPNLVGWVLGTCAVGENALAARIAEFAAAGADELMLTPCTADLDQLHRIADVAMDAAFATPKGLI